MPRTDPNSALVVRVRLPAALERLRRRHDLAASTGVPAHVTLLFPFVPLDALNQRVRREVVDIARGVMPFEVRFARVGRFPRVVYLEPEPTAPFAALTASITARFPDYPPYGGAYPEVIPHLTVTESNEAPLDAIADAVRRSLPFTRHVAALELLAEDRAGHWQGHWRIALGVRP